MMSSDSNMGSGEVDTGAGNGNGKRGGAARSSSAVTGKRDVAQRLRARRQREEELVLAVAGALSRRSTARAEVGLADEQLTVALRDLEGMGLTIDDVSGVLDVPLEELSAAQTGPDRARGRRSGS
jgi:hypothetical protein